MTNNFCLNSWEFYDALAFTITKFWTFEFISWKVLLSFFLPETVLVCLIVYILIQMIVCLHLQQNRKNVSLELLNIVKNTFFWLSVMYVFLLSSKYVGFFSQGQVVLSSYTLFLKLLLSLSTLTILETLPIYLHCKNRHFFELHFVILTNIQRIN